MVLTSRSEQRRDAALLIVDGSDHMQCIYLQALAGWYYLSAPNVQEDPPSLRVSMPR